MRRSLRLSLASLLSLPVVFGDTAGAAASPAAQAPPSAAKPKAVGKHVFTKHGVPAMKLSDVTPTTKQLQAVAGGWAPPASAPIEGKLALSWSKPFVGAVGLNATDVSMQTTYSPWPPVGYNFDGSGSIAVGMPASAIGGSDLLVSCTGALPGMMTAYVVLYTKDTSTYYPIMKLYDVHTKAQFVVQLGIIDPKSMIHVGLAYESVGTWRVDGCTVERL